MERSPRAGFQFGPFLLDTGALTLSRNGVDIPLRPKSFDTLRLLLDRAGEVVSKDDLVESVWSDVIVNDDALAQCVSDVRRALGDDGQLLVRTVPRRGYSFVGKVAAISASASPPHSARVVGLVAAGLLVIALAAALLMRSDPRPGRSPSFAIAILPFETAPDDSEDSWLGDGIAEDIMIELARFREIGVIDRSTSLRYAGEADTVSALRAELGVDYVLQGSLRLLDEDLRIALQLVETASSKVVWAEHYDSPYRDVLEVKRDIVAQIAGRLAGEAQDAGGALAASAAASDLASYELVLRARRAYYQFGRESALEARVLVSRALEMDPDNAVAWELLATIEFQFYVQPYDTRRGSAGQLDAAIAAARNAVSLDPHFATAMAELGSLRSWAGHHEEGLTDLRHAIELNPSNAEIVRQYADALSRAGHQEESLAAWARGAELDPFEIPITRALRARSHILLGDFGQAFDLTADCLRKAPQILPCHLFHIMAATGTQDTDAVDASVRRVRELAPRFTVSGWAEIVKFARPDDGETLSSYLIAAGLAP